MSEKIINIQTKNTQDALEEQGVQTRIKHRRNSVLPYFALLFGVIFLAFNLVVFIQRQNSNMVPGSTSVLGLSEGDYSVMVPRSTTTNSDYLTIARNSIVGTKNELEELVRYKQELESLASNKNSEAFFYYQSLQAQTVVRINDLKSRITKLEQIEAKLNQGGELNTEERLLLLGVE